MSETNEVKYNLGMQPEDSTNLHVKIVEIEGKKYLQTLSLLTGVQPIYEDYEKDGKVVQSKVGVFSNLGNYIFGKRLDGTPLSLRFSLYIGEAKAKSANKPAPRMGKAVDF